MGFGSSSQLAKVDNHIVDAQRRWMRLVKDGSRSSSTPGNWFRKNRSSGSHARTRTPGIRLVWNEPLLGRRMTSMRRIVGFVTLIGLLSAIGCCHDTCDCCRYEPCGACNKAYSGHMTPTPVTEMKPMPTTPAK